MLNPSSPPVMAVVSPEAINSAHNDAVASSDAAVPDLVAQVYDVAPPTERTRLLAQLIQPLGMLSLVAVAGGVFAQLRFRDAPGPLNLRLEDTLNIGSEEVRALADHAQQVSVETVDALRLWLTQSPVLAGSAAALLLVQLLKRRASRRRAKSAEPR